jgi:acyl-CoA synthetase (AMP-forming)/AMP-acid ligase II
MELDEIEQELLRFGNSVVSVAVIVVNEQLIAFIVGELSESNMREQLRQRLPSYMVPDRLIKLNRPMPRLPSGKIDRKALTSMLLLKDDIDKRKDVVRLIDSGKIIITTVHWKIISLYSLRLFSKKN